MLQLNTLCGSYSRYTNGDACKNLVNKSIQALTTRSATQFIDAKGLNNVEMVGSNAVYLNGSDNLINLGEDNSFLNDFRIDLYLKIEALGEYPILINDINGKGWYIRTSASNGRLVIYSNNTGIYASVSSICNNTLNHIIISYIDSTSTLTTEIEGVENNDYTIAQPTFTSNPITKIGVDKVGSYNLKATVCDFDIYDNANGSDKPTFSLPFAEGDGTAVYDVANDTAYHILGATASLWTFKQDVFHYNLENGFNNRGLTSISHYMPVITDINGGSQVITYFNNYLKFVSDGGSVNSLSPKLTIYNYVLMNGSDCDFTFDYVVNSGTFHLRYYLNGVAYVPLSIYLTGSGTETINLKGKKDFTRLFFTINGTSACDIDISNIRIQENTKFIRGFCDYGTALKISKKEQYGVSNMFANIGKKMSAYAKLRHNNLASSPTGVNDSYIMRLTDENNLTIFYLIVESNTISNNIFEGVYGLGVRDTSLVSTGGHSTRLQTKIGDIEEVFIRIDNSVSDTTVFAIYVNGNSIGNFNFPRNIYSPILSKIIVGNTQGLDTTTDMDILQIKLWDDVISYADIDSIEPLIEYDFNNDLTDNKGFADLTPTENIEYIEMGSEFAVNGLEITNPAIENWHNGAETKLQQVNDTLRSYDTNYFWWDSAGNKKQVPFADLKNSADGKISINVVDSDKQRGMFFMFEDALTSAEIKKRDKCVTKGMENLIQFNNGEYAQFNNGEYIQFND